jgi:truncated hemoglobin YjbI
LEEDDMKSTIILGAIVTMAAAMGCSSSSGSTPPSGQSQSGLYERLGSHAGIRKAVDAVVAQELMDPEIAGFFANVGMPGHPTADQIEECFTNLLGNAAGGPEVYPSMGNGFACRDMTAAHASLHIPGATFDKFVTIAAGVLKSAGVADADIMTVGSVLNGTKGLIAPAS